jgi:hypothetical protein
MGLGGKAAKKIIDELASRASKGDEVAMSWYHGTDETFDRFDFSNFGATHGTFGEPSVYATTSKTHAGRFGSDIKELNIKGDVKEIDGDELLKSVYNQHDSYRVKEEFDSELGEYIEQEISFDEWKESLDSDDIYEVLDLDNFIGNEASFAKEEGFDGVRLNFGDFGEEKDIGDIGLVFDPKNTKILGRRYLMS